MWKVPQHEIEDFRNTMFSKRLREYLESRMNNIKEQLLVSKDFKEVLTLQTEFNTYKDIYNKVK